MKKIIFALLTLASCTKEGPLKYTAQLSEADKKEKVFHKLPYLITSFVPHGSSLEHLNQQTLSRYNTPERQTIYRIDTAYFEQTTCMGCKQDWE